MSIQNHDKLISLDSESIAYVCKFNFFKRINVSFPIVSMLCLVDVIYIAN